MNSSTQGEFCYLNDVTKYNRKPRCHLAIFRHILLPNQELSVLYGGPTLNYGEQLSLYVPYMLRLSMTGDLARLQLSDLQSETKPICRTSDLQGERMLICRT